MPRPTIKTDIGVRNTILSRVGPWQAETVCLYSDGVVAGGDGKKIVKAGTFLGSVQYNKSVLKDGTKAAPANGATTEGLLMYDVDVTHGDVEASMLYMGTVGLDRIPEAPTDEAKAALARVTFTKD